MHDHDYKTRKGLGTMSNMMTNFKHWHRLSIFEFQFFCILSLGPPPNSESRDTHSSPVR